MAEAWEHSAVARGKWIRERPEQHPRVTWPEEPRLPFLIAIAGGTASGKTTVCQRITRALGDQRVVMLSLDEFYRDLTPEECAAIADVNFDEPASFDVQTLAYCLDKLLHSEMAQVPIYDFKTSSRKKNETREVRPADVVIIEGILVLSLPEVLERSNMKVFVDTDDDVRLARRIRRDTQERGRNMEGVLKQYIRFVKPSFEKYVLPSRQHADVIIPWVKDDNRVAVELITEHIRSKLSVHDLPRVYPNLQVMPSTMQTRGMHTKIRCAKTSGTEFVFYADRLMRLVVEAALGTLPFQMCVVNTPGDCPYSGVDFCKDICGVSIIGGGDAMETALRACCHGIKIGRVVIHRNQSFAYEMRLPEDISDRHVLLMDPVLCVETVVPAVELLATRHGVKMSRMIFLSLIAAGPGIREICSRYPDLQVVTTEIDDSVGGEIRPGIGDFASRYFGSRGSEIEPFSLESIDATHTPRSRQPAAARDVEDCDSGSRAPAKSDDDSTIWMPRTLVVT